MTVNEVGALIEMSRLLSERSVANFVFQILKKATEYASDRPILSQKEWASTGRKAHLRRIMLGQPMYCMFEICGTA
jgi:hypothetical protein